MSSAADEHRVIARLFTDRVRGVAPDAWDNPAPCEGWVARDVVRHLLEWFPSFLKAGAGVDLPKPPPVDDDPVAAWTAHSDGVQALLDDPATPARVLSNPHLGELPLDRAVTMFYTADVFLHTWDPGARHRPGRAPRPRQVCRTPRRDAADGPGAAGERPLRSPGRGARRRRRADPAAGVHRPQPARLEAPSRDLDEWRPREGR